MDGMSTGEPGSPADVASRQSEAPRLVSPARMLSASPGGYRRAGSPTATQPIGIRVCGGTTQPIWTAPRRATLLARPIRAPLKTMAPVAMNTSSPISTGPPSALITAPCITQLPGAIRTSPLSTAAGAT